MSPWVSNNGFNHLKPSSIKKNIIDRHVGRVISGLSIDTHHGGSCSSYLAELCPHDEKFKVESVTQTVYDPTMRFGESVHGRDAMMSRSLGVALFIAGADEKSLSCASSSSALLPSSPRDMVPPSVRQVRSGRFIILSASFTTTHHQSSSTSDAILLYQRVYRSSHA